MKQLILFLAGLVAPVVTLFYRKGIWLTPDDPVSPFGMYEPRMRSLYAHLPAWVVDWYWLGIRNSAFGLAYKWKPESLKGVTNYEFLLDRKIWSYQAENKRVISVVLPEGVFKEHTYFGPFFHIIWGYRLRPVRDSAWKYQEVKEINMDGRPIFSIRWGKNDD